MIERIARWTGSSVDALIRSSSSLKFFIAGHRVLQEGRDRVRGALYQDRSSLSVRCESPQTTLRQDTTTVPSGIISVYLRSTVVWYRHTTKLVSPHHQIKVGYVLPPMPHHVELLARDYKPSSSWNDGESHITFMMIRSSLLPFLRKKHLHVNLESVYSVHLTYDWSRCLLGREYLLCSVRRSSEKNPELFIDLCERLWTANPSLSRVKPFICGASQSEEYSNRLVNRLLKVCPSAIIKGILTAPELVEVYKKTVLNVHPSLYEVCSLTWIIVASTSLMWSSIMKAYGLTMVEAGAFQAPSIAHEDKKSIGVLSLLDASKSK